MKHIYKTIIRCEVVVSASLLISILLVILWQVVSRSILAIPLVWSEEVARVMFIWLVFLAAAPVLAEGKHIVVDVLTEKAIGERAIQVIDFMAGLTVFASCAFMAWASYGLVDSVSGLTLPTSGLPQVLLSGASLVVFVLLSLHSAVGLVNLVRPFIGGNALNAQPWRG